MASTSMFQSKYDQYFFRTIILHTAICKIQMLYYLIINNLINYLINKLIKREYQ